jgi:hypothetical protein
MNTPRINPQELSSRKLWQLAETPSTDDLSAEEMSDVIAELAKRCHDLDEFDKISKLEENSQG